MKMKKFMALAVALCLFICIAGNVLVFAADSKESWNLLETDAWFDGYIVSADTGLYMAKDGYAALELVAVNDEDMCVLYLPNGNNIHTVYYDSSQNYLGGDIVSAPRGILLELPENCAYMTISMAKTEIRTSFLAQDGHNGVYVVSKDSDTKYASVKSAVAAIKNTGTVVVMPGTYRGNVQAWGKEVNIIGVDKENCILENGSSAYTAPPLEIAAGTVKNLTIKARGSNAEGNGAGNTEPGAYGVHVEDNALFESILKFENCYIYSDYNAAVGMGLRGGCSVQFINSQLKGKEFGLFCHDSAYKSYSGVQNLSMINCVIEGMQGGGAVRFDSQGVTGARVNVLFVNTILRNKNITTVAAKSSTKLLSTRNNGGKGTDENWMGLKNYFLEEDSMGNNILEMDY